MLLKVFLGKSVDLKYFYLISCNKVVKISGSKNQEESSGQYVSLTYLLEKRKMLKRSWKQVFI